MRKPPTFALRTVPLVITVAIASQAFAQEKMDEVVVSAQKRIQRIQDVPMAVSAISGQALEDRKIDGAADLQGAVPNVNVVSAPAAGLIAATSIRGLGTGQPAIWMDPAVGMYVDGVFVGKNQGALFDMLDLERVEVLRGPQGTLFGRNTLGGAVNFVTRKPSGQFSGNVGVEVGNYGRSVQKLSIDTPKTEQGLSFTIAARKEKQDGWLANPTAADKWGNRNRDGFKLNALLEVSKDTQLSYAYDQSNINETPPGMSLIKGSGYFEYLYGSKPYATALAPYVQADVPTSTSSSFAPQQNLKVTGHTWGFETALNSNNKLKYTGSARKMTYHDKIDLDGTNFTDSTLTYGLQLYGSQTNTNYSTNSHELQITGSATDINYVAGLYYFKDSGTSIIDQWGLLAGGGAKQENFGLGTSAKAAYGQLDYALNKETTLTGGLRYTTEEKTGTIWRTGVTPMQDTPLVNPTTWLNTMNPGDVNAKATFSSWTPSVALSHKLNSTQMVFGRIAKGFKSGGFPLQAATVAQATTAYNPEHSTSYEAGFKGANSTASYSATAFLTKLTDQQLSYLPPGTSSPTVGNAGATTYKGFELEGTLKVSPDTKVQVGYGYIQATIDQYLTKNVAGANVDVASNLVAAYAPKNTLNLNVESRLATTSLGRLKGLLEYRYTGAYYNYNANLSMTGPTTTTIKGNYAPDSLMPARGVVNGRLTLDQMNVGGPGQMDISLWVKNLTNKQTKQNMIDLAVLQIGTWSAPRTFGITANYKW